MVTISRRSTLAASASGALLAAAAGTAAQPATTAAAATPDVPSMKSLQDLIEAARANSPGLAALMTRHLPGLQLGGAAAVPVTDVVPMGDTTTVGTIASGNVVAVWGQDFLFSVASDEPATISIDRQTPVAMTRVPGTNYWFRVETSGLARRIGSPFFQEDTMSGPTRSPATPRIVTPFRRQRAERSADENDYQPYLRRGASELLDLRKCRHRHCPRRAPDDLAGRAKLRRCPGPNQFPTADRDGQPRPPKADSADGASADRARYRR
jgi:hypothetical protein